MLFAQSGEGSLQGTVSDSSGAVIPSAAIIVTNDATQISVKTASSSAGYYIISPLHPGTYKVQVSAAGFELQVQENVVVDALQARVYNAVLRPGEESETITVTAAPPVLDTADATLGMTIENDTYTNLPLQMSSQQRDPTAFVKLTPGAQVGTRFPVISGTGNMLGQLYVEGMPATTVNQQGDNRLVSLAFSIEAVDQFQLLTSSPPAEYSGAGAMNFTMKSGGLKYHGQVSDFVRNTIFDAWSFTAKAATTKNALGTTVYAPKPVEHQNELSASVGGVVPRTQKKLFFFVAYDRYHLRKPSANTLYTIPTPLMLAGDFTELNGNVGSGGQSGTGTNNPAIIYDPTSNSCIGNTCTRKPFVAMKNGVETYNVIPSGMISPITKAMAAFMPSPTNSASLTNNYLGSIPTGYDDHLIDWRVDYDMADNQRISFVGAMGHQQFLNNFSTFLPMPYATGTYSDTAPRNYVVEHVYTIRPHLVNQVKYGFTRFVQNQESPTDGDKRYLPTNFGLSNLPQGEASTDFLGATFGTTTAYNVAMRGWSGGGSSVTSPNNYALADNLQWLRGKHALSVGATQQWQEINVVGKYSGPVTAAYNAYSTANFAPNSNALSTGSTSAPSGFAFASFMLGAVAGSSGSANAAPSIALSPIPGLGGRYRPLALYVRDTYKVNYKLTIDFGLRWDYLPPFHEVLDRWTFLNPNLANPLTGTNGMLQFAGNSGGAGVSCQCRTPVQTYWKNFGPRVGVAYLINAKTVLRAGYATVYSQGGGVGGRAGSYQGTGSTGFNMTAIGPTEVGAGSSAGPSFYLNNGSGFASLGLSNSSYFGSGYAYPSAPTPDVSAQELNTGYYVKSGAMVNAGSVSYADPYFSGRAPQISMYNFGFERSITPDITLAVNYAGNESHFIIDYGASGGNARGLWSNQVDPKYVAILGSVKDSTGTKPILNAAATPANAAIVQKYFPNVSAPASFTAAGTISSSATIGQMLKQFPQYSGVTDTWGNVGNYNYQSIQVVLKQRMHHGLTFNINYNFSKNVGDDGTFRSGYDIPVGTISNSTKGYKQDRIDRSRTTIDAPHALHAFGVYKLPFGKGGIGAQSSLVNLLAGGWQFSGIYTFTSGSPILVTWSGSTATTVVGQGTAMPDINPSFSGPIRINGKYGSGPKGYNTCNLGISPIGGSCTAINYISANGFSTPTNISTVSGQPQSLIGNAPRSSAYGLRNPYAWDVDASLRRSIKVPKDGVELILEVDCLNAWNNVLFGAPNGSWASSSGSSTFGQITSIGNSPRDWQFAAHIKF